MKKYVLLTIVVFGLLAISCDNSTLPETKNTGGNKFPAPSSVTVWLNNIEWKYVDGASDYQVYVKNLHNGQIQKLDNFKYYNAYDKCVGSMENSDFQKLSVYGFGPYQIGVIAVSPAGLYSDTTWSNTFTSLE